MRLVIVDDHKVVRDGLRWMLSDVEDIDIVGEADSAAAALDLLRSEPADVVLLDVRMPDVNGLEALPRLLEQRPGIRVLMLTMHGQGSFVRRALQDGASGYLLKSAGRDELIRALEAVDAGDIYVHGDVVSAFEPGNRIDVGRGRLTPRERQVLGLVADGFENKQIAVELAIAEATVKAYLRDIFERLDVSTRAQAVAVGLREGLID
jgi:DNA-binding NarL/FixJ family response regulator